MSPWHLDIDAWPGPDRKRWPNLRDIIEESPDGRHVAVVYACGEIGVGKEVGRFALLGGPPDAPTVLLRPRRLTCLVREDGTTLRWIGTRYCVATPCRLRPPGPHKAYGGTLYIDVEQRRAACVATVAPGANALPLPTGLAWRSWTWLSFWPWLWPL